MISEIRSALKSELDEFVKSALKTHPSDNHAFHYGKMIGTNLGLQRALEIVEDLISKQAGED